MAKEKLKANGITLIALIITIIVMLILVGVSVTVALNGELFIKAKEAGNRTEDEMERELGLLDGVEVGDNKYASYEDYLNNNPIVETPDIELPEGWTVATTPEKWTNTNVIAIKDGNNNTVPLPEGYSVSEVEGEYTVSGGLVIKDSEEIPNEFVWIPVAKISSMVMCQNHGGSVELDDNLQCPTCLENTKLAGKLYMLDRGAEFDKDLKNQTYSVDTGIREPAILTDFDTQPAFDSYGGGTYSGDDMYQKEFDAMAKSVATYGGFYVGRYETGGANEERVVSKPDRGMNGDGDINKTYWHKMYKMQKEFAKDSKAIASTMIWGCQYDQVMIFVDGKLDGTGEKEFDIKEGSSDRHSQNKATGTGNVIADKVANIYDLEGNMCEWTLEGFDTGLRVIRGGYHRISNPAGMRNAITLTNNGTSSR